MWEAGVFPDKNMINTALIPFLHAVHLCTLCAVVLSCAHLDIVQHRLTRCRWLTPARPAEIFVDKPGAYLVVQN